MVLSEARSSCFTVNGEGYSDAELMELYDGYKEDILRPPGKENKDNPNPKTRKYVVNKS